MKKPKIIILTSQVISERDFQRLGIDTIEAKSQLQIFDFTSFVQPRSFEKQFNSRKKDLNIYFIKKLNQLSNLKSNFKDSNLIISLMGNQHELNNSIYKFIKPYEKKVCLVNITASPMYPLNIKFSIFKRFYCGIFSERRFFFINKFRKIIFIIKKLFSKRISLKPGYLASCGEEVINFFSDALNEKTKIIKTCSYDYVLSKLVKERILDYKYIVFLDECIINHYELEILNRKIEKENIYYEELNKFFYFIEKNFKTKVVIASHPRADLEFNKVKFPNHKVFKGITPQLMKYSEGCITHASTSINFAVIFSKPILFITTNRMLRTRFNNELLSSWFNKIPLNISKSYSYEEVFKSFKINKIYMKQYFRKFISFSEDTVFGFGSLIDSLTLNE